MAADKEIAQDGEVEVVIRVVGPDPEQSGQLGEVSEWNERHAHYGRSRGPIGSGDVGDSSGCAGR